MNNSVLLLVVLMPIMSMLNLLFNHSHFLMTLLSLEGIMLSLVLFIAISMAVINAPNTAVLVVMLTFSACEASIGLGLMVLLSRSFGTDMLSLLTMSKC